MKYVDLLFTRISVLMHLSANVYDKYHILTMRVSNSFYAAGSNPVWWACDFGHSTQQPTFFKQKKNIATASQLFKFSVALFFF